MIDIGVNLTNSRFDEDRTDVIARAIEAGVSKMILTGTSLESSKNAIELAERYTSAFPQTLYSTVGIHPHEASTCTSESLNQLESLIVKNREFVVAVGETGLDFNRNFSPVESQISSFRRQIELAIKANLPLFLHERDAFDQQMRILRSFGEKLPPSVIHCFAGNRESLETYLDMGLWIGITGWVCDERRGLELQSLIREIPLDKLMVETDSPYLIPRSIRPKPKSNRNEPAFLIAVIDMVAHCYDRSADEIRRITSSNAREFFQL